MRSVWKYPLTDDPCIISVPRGADLVLVGAQGGDITLWFEVNPDAPEVARVFTIKGTGHPVLPAMVHVGSVQVGEFVWHVYEMGEGRG